MAMASGNASSSGTPIITMTATQIASPVPMPSGVCTGNRLTARTRTVASAASPVLSGVENAVCKHLEGRLEESRKTAGGDTERVAARDPVKARRHRLDSARDFDGISIRRAADDHLGQQ